MRLSSLDLRLVMCVLDGSGKMSVPMAVKRGGALDAMGQEGISDATLEALMDDDAQNTGDARSGLPRRTLRFWLAPRSEGGPSARVSSSGSVGLSGEPPRVVQVGTGGWVPVGFGGAPPRAVEGALVEAPARCGGAGLNLGAGAASLATGADLDAFDSRTLGVSVYSLGFPVGLNKTRAAHQYRGDFGGGPSGPPGGASAAGDYACPWPAAARAQPPAIAGRGAVEPSVSDPGLAVREPVFTDNDCACLFHVVMLKDNRPAVEWAKVPLARAELDRAHVGLWVGTLAPM